MSDKPEEGTAFYVMDKGTRCSQDAADKAFDRAEKHHGVKIANRRKYDEGGLKGWIGEVA